VEIFLIQNQKQWTYTRFVHIIIIIITGYFLNYNYSHLFFSLIIIEFLSDKLSVTTVNAHIDAWLSGEHQSC